MIGGAALAGLTATQALAQAAPAAPPAAGTTVQELVVTGSRIPQTNLTSVSPVQAVTAQEIRAGGRVSTIDVLNQLPQTGIATTLDFGPTSNALNNPGGTATVDLRSLGPQRTLVLVDGKRLGIGDPNTGNTNPAPDINQIPSQLIDRIEVLTGGASAVYGSDAVAGVVNFIMKHNFEGLQIDADFGVNQHGQHNDLAQGLLRKAGIPVPGGAWDGRSADYSVIFGANAPDGKGNITGYVTYHNQNPVFQSARDFSNCQIFTDPIACGGSSNSNKFSLSNGNRFDLGGGTTASSVSVFDHSFVRNGTPGTTPPALFNSQPYISLIQQDTRYTGGFFANYEINSNFKPYVTFQYMHDQTNTQVAPAGLFSGSGAQASGGFLTNCNNPLLSAQQVTALGCTSADIASGATRDMLIGRRNIEGGPRQFEYDHDNFRIVYGTKGRLWGPFNYDLYGSYYYTSVYVNNQNFLSISRAQNALLVGGTATNPTCLTGGKTCVPYNIWQDGGVTTAALQYLAEAGTSRGSTTERIIEGTITGDLSEWGIKSPWATDGVGVAAGFQNRRDHLTYAPDQAELSNDLSGFGGAATAIDSNLSDIEGYGELRAPIVQDMPFAHDVSLSLGYRYSDYSTGVTADTYKIGGEWAPTADIRLRGGFNRAVRAPNIIELFTPQSVTNTSVVSSDPCAGPTPAASLAACERTGVTPASYGRIQQCPAAQCAVLQGGNPDLAPERANTYTVGAVFTPRFIPGLYASIDYFHIDLKGIITNIPLGVTLNECLATGNPTFCSNVVRNPVSGILFGTSVGAGGYIVGTDVNVAAEVVSGIDFQATYKLGFDRFGHDEWGGLSFNFTGSWNEDWRVTPTPTSKTYNCSGLFGPQCGGLFPVWRHVFRTTWNAPYDVQVTATWRYIGGAEFEGDSNQPTIGGNTTPNELSHTVPAVNYLDLAVNWNVNEKLAVRGGINNIFDRDPPLIDNAIVGTGLPNTYPTYDLLGRHLFVGLTARF
jgi:outer membrane receptor protein involved in Fe transport